MILILGTFYGEITDLQMGKIDKVGLAMNVVTTGANIAETWTSLAKLNANNALFERNLDVLYELSYNGARIVVRDAAKAVIEALGEGFGNVLSDAILADVGAGAMDILITVASKNPYVAAIVFARDVIDMVTGISADIRQSYEVLYYSSFTNAVQNLIYSTVKYDGVSYYANKDDELDFHRYLIHLAQIRILSEKNIMSS